MRNWMIRELALRPGDTGFEAAAIVGERGHLISTDFSPEMVEVARRRGAAHGLGNVDYRVIDAEHLELEADLVDGVLCRFGYMLVANLASDLSETRRVLRPGRRLALSVWGGAPEGNPWITILAWATCRRQSPAIRTRSAWPARSGRGHCCRPRASPPCVRRRCRCASPTATWMTS